MRSSIWSGRGSRSARGYLATRDKYYRKWGMHTLRGSTGHRIRAARIHRAFGGGWVS